jgi:hypothetical protein
MLTNNKRYDVDEDKWNQFANYKWREKEAHSLCTGAVLAKNYKVQGNIVACRFTVCSLLEASKC